MLARLLKESPVGPVALRSDVHHVVLEIYCFPSEGKNYYRIEPRDGGAPGLHDSQHFEITSNVLPAFWVASDGEGGALYFRPQDWTAEGFWGAYFDGEPWARRSYSHWRDEMLKELPESMRY